MSSEQIQTIEVLGRTFHIKCDDENTQSLRQAAELLNRQASQLRGDGRLYDKEQIAVLSALNACHELLKQKSQALNQVEQCDSKASALEEKINVAIQS